MPDKPDGFLVEIDLFLRHEAKLAALVSSHLGQKKSPAIRRGFFSQVVEAAVDVPQYPFAALLAVAAEMLGVQVAEEHLADGALVVPGFEALAEPLFAAAFGYGGVVGCHVAVQVCKGSGPSLVPPDTPHSRSRKEERPSPIF